MASTLDLFNTQVNNLLESLYKTFPHMTHIGVLQSQLEITLMVNPRKVYTGFAKYVYPHKEEIMSKNENYFLEDNVEIKEDYLSSTLKLKELWSTVLTHENKETIWSYFQVFIVLAERIMKEDSTNHKGMLSNSAVI